MTHDFVGTRASGPLTDAKPALGMYEDKCDFYLGLLRRYDDLNARGMGFEQFLSLGYGLIPTQHVILGAFDSNALAVNFE